VQNLLVTRFANTLFEPLWNSSWIDHVQITAAESLGVGNPRRLLRQVRGAARHAAEPPLAGAVPGRDGAADLHRPRGTVRDEKLKVLQAPENHCRPMTSSEIP